MEIFGNGIPVFGEADDRTLNPIRVCTRTAGTLALLPDHRLGRFAGRKPVSPDLFPIRRKPRSMSALP